MTQVQVQEDIGQVTRGPVASVQSNMRPPHIMIVRGHQPQTPKYEGGFVGLPAPHRLTALGPWLAIRSGWQPRGKVHVVTLHA